MKSTLTDRQRAVYEFIRDKIQNRGYGPTVREISREFGIKSPNGVVCHLKALEKKGLITREPNMSRAIELTTEKKNRTIPMVGQIAAGQFHEAIENHQEVDLNDLFRNRDCYMLRIAGDSMIEAHIADGDMVVVEPRSEAVNGEIVVAETSDGNATLKYWFKEADRIRLQPANSSMVPIYATDAKVNGVVVGVIRKV
jgi:repressor LexA